MTKLLDVQLLLPTQLEKLESLTTWTELKFSVPHISDPINAPE